MNSNESTKALAKAFKNGKKIEITTYHHADHVANATSSHSVVVSNQDYISLAAAIRDWALFNFWGGSYPNQKIRVLED